MVAKQRTILWESVSRDYWSECQSEANSLREKCYSKLPNSLQDRSEFKVLDIGGGFCGYNILLARQFQGMHLTVIDASEEDQQYKLGFQDKGERYCDFGSLEYLFRHSDIGNERFNLIDFRKTDIPAWAAGFSEGFDVVQSLYSWCFHYPYRTYRSAVHNLLKPGGVLIVDCRTVDQQVDHLLEDYEHVTDLVSHASPTSRRMILRKSLLPSSGKTIEKAQHFDTSQDAIRAEMNDLGDKIESMYARYRELKSLLEK